MSAKSRLKGGRPPRMLKRIKDGALFVWAPEPAKKINEFVEVPPDTKEVLIGHEPEQDVVEETADETEDTVPIKRGPGRPRKVDPEEVVAAMSRQASKVT